MNAPEDYLQFGGIKRNDRYIRAFSKFVNEFPSCPHSLTLINYGPDFDNSLDLASKLSISNNIKVIKKKLERKNIYALLKNSDVCFNAFRENIFDFGGVCKESLASSCILFNYMNNISFTHEMPAFDCLHEDQIFENLRFLWKNQWSIKLIKESSYEWHEKYYGNELAKSYAAFFLNLIRDPSLLCKDYFLNLVNVSKSIFGNNFKQYLSNNDKDNRNSPGKIYRSLYE